MMSCRSSLSTAPIVKLVMKADDSAAAAPPAPSSVVAVVAPPPCIVIVHSEQNNGSNTNDVGTLKTANSIISIGY